MRTITLVLTFREESTAANRDNDIAYLQQFLEPLTRECSSLKSYEILPAPADAGDTE